jgi:hypothetical protein
MSSDTETSGATAASTSEHRGDTAVPDAPESGESRPGESGPNETEASETGVGETAPEESAGTGSSSRASRYDSPEVPRVRPALIATAVALPVALIIAVLLVAVFSRQHPAREPLALGSIAAPAAGSPACTDLMRALPDKVGDYTHAELAQPAPPATVAWQLPDGGDPIVLRCGLDRPQEFTAASGLQVVNDVSWFEVRDQTSGVTSGTWYAVDRGIYLAATMPDKAGPTPLQDLSNTIAKVLPTRPLDPGPVPH